MELSFHKSKILFKKKDVHNKQFVILLHNKFFILSPKVVFAVWFDSCCCQNMKSQGEGKQASSIPVT